MKEFYSSGIPYLDDLMGGVLLVDCLVWILGPGTHYDCLVWILGPGTHYDYFLECFLTIKEDNPHWGAFFRCLLGSPKPFI